MKNRPFGVTLLSWLVLCFSAWNFVRFGAVIFFWSTLKEYNLSVNPACVAGMGLFWGMAGLMLAWGLQRGKAWGRASSLSAAAGYASWYWIDRLALQPPRPNWPYALTVTVILLLLYLVIMIRPNTRQWFKDRKSAHPGEIHEQS